MLPEHELSFHAKRSAYQKVAEWTSKSLQCRDNEDQDLCLVLPNDFGNPFANSVASQLSRRNSERNDIIEKTEKLFSIVFDILGGSVLNLYKHNFSYKEKEDVIRALWAEGYDVTPEDFWDVILVAKAVKRGNLTKRYQPLAPDRQFRHASLNCYDYDRLKDEMEDLIMEVGERYVERLCPILMRIVREAKDGESADYPGRHLPFNRIKGRTAARYQCLRIMDEILCTAADPIKSSDMNSLIYNKAVEYGIIGKTTKRSTSRRAVQADANSDKVFKNISESALKKMYVILSELINVEYSHGKKIKYNRDVYDVPGKNGRRYREYKNGKRLSAFTVDISVQESWTLHREIGRLRAEFFYDDRELFAERFPLISMLGYMEEVALDYEEKSDILNFIESTDLRTVNYRQPKYPGLKKKVENALSLHMPIPVKSENGWEIVYPLSIKESRGMWVLKARTIDSIELRLISPESLVPAFGSEPGESIETDRSLFISDDDNSQEPPLYADNIIGISPLFKNIPFDVTLELTEDGVEDVMSKNSEFMPLKPENIQKRSGYYERPTGDRPCYNSRISTHFPFVTFKVYINDDFLSELFRLDRNAKLVDIQPNEVNDLYEIYYEQQMGKPRVPLNERPESMKVLKVPKKPSAE